MSAAPTPGPYTLGHKETTPTGGMSVEIDAPDHGAIATAVWRMEDDAIVGKNSPRLESTAQLLAASFDMAQALDQIVNGTLIDGTNHDDNGLMTLAERCSAGRYVPEQLRRHHAMAVQALKKAGFK